MQDVQNYEYYDPTPQAAPTPWWKRKRTWQRAGLALALVLVLIFAAIAVANALKNRQIVQDRAELMKQVDTLEAQIGSECKTGDTACLDRARADAARNLGVSQACDTLEGAALKTCVTLIAQDQKDPEVCKSLSGADQTSCADTAYLLLAKSQADLKMCSQISVPALIASCTTQVKAKVIASGQCETAGLDPALCQDAQALKDAIAQGDLAACQALPDSHAQTDCATAIASIDADHDGLVVADEVSLGLSDTVADSDGDGLSDGDEVHVYLTDPQQADTDGDGFSDGTEVSGGYDPLK